MKTVYFVRHAKSSWDDPSLRDIDRPLNPRGLRDAPFMAKLIRAKSNGVDAIISSPATRAFSTATYFAEAFGMEKEDIVVRKEIYEAFTSDITSIIHALNDQWNAIIIFGHNPTFTSVINLYSDQYLPNMPTCGVGKVTAPVNSWSQFNEQTANLEELFVPKQYL